MTYCRKITALLFTCVLMQLAINAYSHSYMDFAVRDVWMDKQCHVNVTVVNQGGDLPAHFYYSVAPAWLNIQKGEQQERSVSFTRLDKQQVLANNQQALQFKSEKTYVNIPSPVTVSIEYGTEFGDFNQRNDTLTRAMDCRVGEGQVDGRAIIYDAPDVALESAAIDAKTCTLKLEMRNKTDIALNAKAWSEEGVIVMLKNADTGQRLQSIPLSQLDPKKHFTFTTQILQWQSDFMVKQPRVTVGIWYVTGDNDFSNNTKTLETPSNCLMVP